MKRRKPTKRRQENDLIARIRSCTPVEADKMSSAERSKALTEYYNAQQVGPATPSVEATDTHATPAKSSTTPARKGSWYIHRYYGPGVFAYVVSQQNDARKELERWKNGNVLPRCERFVMFWKSHPHDIPSIHTELDAYNTSYDARVACEHLTTKHVTHDTTRKPLVTPQYWAMSRSDSKKVTK